MNRYSESRQPQSVPSTPAASPVATAGGTVVNGPTAAGTEAAAGNIRRCDSLARVRHDINNSLLVLVSSAELLTLDATLPYETRLIATRILNAVNELRQHVSRIAPCETASPQRSVTSKSASDRS